MSYIPVDRMFGGLSAKQNNFLMGIELIKVSAAIAINFSVALDKD